MSFQQFVRPGANSATALRHIENWGRRSGVHKTTLLSQNYEKPTVRRNRIAEEKAYYPSHLLLKRPSDPNDECRLLSLKPTGFFNSQEGETELKRLNWEIKNVTKRILSMQAKQADSEEGESPSCGVALLNGLHERCGVVPRISSLVKMPLMRGFTRFEVESAHADMQYLSECLQRRQKILEFMYFKQAPNAKWTEAMDERELRELAYMRGNCRNDKN